MTHTRAPYATLAVLLAAVTAAATLAGCASRPHAAGSTPSATPTPTSTGIADRRAADIVMAAQINVALAGSVHVSGHIHTTTGKFVEYDFRIHGHDGMATRTTDGVLLTVIKSGDHMFIRGDRTYWTSVGGPRAAKIMNGRYLRVPADDQNYAMYLDYFNAGNLIAPTGTLTRGDVTMVNGFSVVPIVEAGPVNSTLYVATRGTPLPLRIETSDGNSRLDFLYGEAFEEDLVPSAAEVIDLTELQRQLG